MSPSLTALLAAAAVAVFLGASSSHAAEPPDNVAQAVTDAAQACKDMGGTPNTDKVLSVSDLNGDGGEDWIADFGKLQCKGDLNPLCGKAGGKPMMYVTTSGDACNKPTNETCKYTYRLDKDAVVPLQ